MSSSTLIPNDDNNNQGNGNNNKNGADRSTITSSSSSTDNNKAKMELFPARLHYILRTPQNGSYNTLTSPPPFLVWGLLHLILSVHLSARERDMESDGLESIMSFCPGGIGVIIHDNERLAKEILPLWFRQTKAQSFTRQLKNYGFQKSYDGPTKGGYVHPLFVRDCPELCERILLNRGSGGEKRVGRSSNKKIVYGKQVAAAAVGKTKKIPRAVSPSPKVEALSTPFVDATATTTGGMSFGVPSTRSTSRYTYVVGPFPASTSYQPVPPPRSIENFLYPMFPTDGDNHFETFRLLPRPGLLFPNNLAAAAANHRLRSFLMVRQSLQQERQQQQQQQQP